MKKIKRKKFRILKLFFILFIIFILYNKFSISKYKIIKQDYNKNYSGIGQKQVKNKDGYFTTFTTENNKVYIEYKQNGSSSWNNNEYWGGTMEENGCGITALSIILSGYNINYTPEDLRKKYFPVLDYGKLSQELNKTFGIENSDFYFDITHCSKKAIIEHLKTDRPIIVCVWKDKKSNRWTEKSHYMVLLATDGEKVYVSNPNGLQNQKNSSGWYSIDEITPYIAKILYINKY